MLQTAHLQSSCAACAMNTNTLPGVCSGMQFVLSVLSDNQILVAGTATVEGLDIRSDMADIYAMMGVCPQHDLLWETLTGREHLLFYGRLKNLKVSPPCSAHTHSSPGSG